METACKIMVFPDDKSAFCLYARDFERYEKNPEYFVTPIGLLDSQSYASFKNPEFKHYAAKQIMSTRDMKKIFSLIPLDKNTYIQLENEMKKQQSDVRKKRKGVEEKSVYETVKDISAREHGEHESYGSGTYGAVTYHKSQNVIKKRITTQEINSETNIDTSFVLEVAVYSLIDKIRKFQNSNRIEYKCCPQMLSIVAEPKNEQIFFQRGKGSLESMIYQFSWKSIKRVFFSILLCMKTFQSQGLIHCDIKPQNIIVPKEFIGMIIDWGICRIDTSKSQTNNKQGNIQTLWFRSPEILWYNIFKPEENDLQYSYKIDVFSLGLILLFMIFKHYFCKADDPQGMINSYIRKLCGISIDKTTQEIVNNSFANFIANGTHKIMFDNMMFGFQKVFTQEIRQQIQQEGISWDLSQLSELISGMLDFNPKNRYSYDQCINSPFFQDISALIVKPVEMPYLLGNMPIVENIIKIWTIKLGKNPEEGKHYEHARMIRKKGFIILSEIFTEPAVDMQSVLLAQQIIDLFMIITKDTLTEAQVFMVLAASISLSMKIFLPDLTMETISSIVKRNVPELFSNNSFKDVLNWTKVESHVIYTLKGNIYTPTLFSWLIKIGNGNNINSNENQELFEKIFHLYDSPRIYKCSIPERAYAISRNPELLEKDKELKININIPEIRNRINFVTD